ncbi:hypothetical protein E2C01_066940 [Portunus trituberculatus]|uniref:Uncharacterized protein n=1 Tax=Portunus trituberculatus TaxID=210409 RepID=A0A5B7HV93_PORTR|nr:hypothetical protein [Portunus trituberculatus]
MKSSGQPEAPPDARQQVLVAALPLIGPPCRHTTSSPSAFPLSIPSYFDGFWTSTLGEVMVSLGQLEASSKCLQTAIEMEAKSPILPFTSIPFCFE